MAVAGAVEIPVAERFKYGRRASGADGTDISTLVSAVCALAGLAAVPASRYEDEGFTTL
jgi:hypothetical protein